MPCTDCISCKKARQAVPECYSGAITIGTVLGSEYIIQVYKGNGASFEAVKDTTINPLTFSFSDGGNGFFEPGWYEVKVVDADRLEATVTADSEDFDCITFQVIGAATADNGDFSFEYL